MWKLRITNFCVTGWKQGNRRKGERYRHLISDFQLKGVGGTWEGEKKRNYAEGGT